MNTYESYPLKPVTAVGLERRRLILGKGTNDAWYLTTTRNAHGRKITCPFYSTWRSMLMRAYGKKYQTKHSTYLGVTVCDEWHAFMAFRAWALRQDYGGNTLDKDIILPGNKTYAPEFCAFVSHRTNTVIHENPKRRGAWPLGVDYVKRRDVYRARTGRKTIGHYPTAELAHIAWRTAKAGILLELAAEQSDTRIRDALIIRATGLTT